MRCLRDLWARLSFELWAVYADARWKATDRMRGRRPYIGNGRCGLLAHELHPDFCGPDCAAWGAELLWCPRCCDSKVPARHDGWDECARCGAVLRERRR